MIKIYDGRSEFYQWDLDRQIILSDPNVDEVHFCNKTDDCSLVVEVYEKDGLRLANVPNILLQTNWPINVFAYCGGRYTKESAKFKVNARSKPADYIYTETEIITVEKEVEKAIEEAREKGYFGEDGKSAYEIAVDNGYEGTEEEWLEYLAASPSQMQPHMKLITARTSSVAGWYTLAETGTTRIPRTGLFKLLVKDNSGTWDEIFFIAKHSFYDEGQITVLSRNKKGNLITSLGMWNVINSGKVNLEVKVNATYHASNKLEIVLLMLESKFDVAGINKWKLVDITKSTTQTANHWNRKEFDISTIEERITGLTSSIGDINTALDELHTYAQNLVNGGNA